MTGNPQDDNRIMPCPRYLSNWKNVNWHHLNSTTELSSIAPAIVRRQTASRRHQVPCPACSTSRKRWCQEQSNDHPIDGLGEDHPSHRSNSEQGQTERLDKEASLSLSLSFVYHCVDSLIVITCTDLRSWIEDILVGSSAMGVVKDTNVS